MNDRRRAVFCPRIAARSVDFTDQGGLYDFRQKAQRTDRHPLRRIVFYEKNIALRFVGASLMVGGAVLITIWGN